MIKVKPELKNFVRPSEHSTYSPSSMDRLVNCPASVRLCKDIPEEEERDYAKEGTTAHSYAEAKFYEDMFGIEISQELEDEVNGFKSALEIRQGGYVYSAELQNWLANPEVGEVLWYGLEKGVPIFPKEGAFGTGDCIIVGSMSAVIMDFKFGKKKVHADSVQLRAYAAGVLAHLENVPADYRIYSVIVQPRVEMAASVHCYTVEEIQSFLGDIANMIEATKDLSAQPNRGDKKHCFWCPASRTKDPALKCPAIKEELVMVSGEDFKGYLRDSSLPVESLSVPNVKRDEALKKLMYLAPIVAEAAKMAEAEFSFRLSQGHSIEGVEFVESEGNRKWANGDSDTLKVLTERFPDKKDELVKIIPASQKLKGIGDIEKIVGKGKLNDLTIKPITKKLELVDETRASLTQSFISYESEE